MSHLGYRFFVDTNFAGEPLLGPGPLVAGELVKKPLISTPQIGNAPVHHHARRSVLGLGNFCYQKRGGFL